MKKVLSLLLVGLLLAGNCYATATRESSAKDAVPMSVYGKDATGAVQALRLTTGGVIILESAKTLVRKESSQALASAVLSYTTNFSEITKITGIYFTATAGITETVTISLNSKTGATYDTVLVSEDLVSESALTYIPAGDLVLQDGDEITVGCTKNGGVQTVYVTIIGETIQS